MEKDQLISMIHLLVKREDERAQENQELKDMVKELRDTHKQDVKTQASLLKTQSNLMKSIDNLTNQVSDLTTQNKSLQHKVNDLLSQISVGNKVRFGSKSQKGIKKNAVPVQDREKDKDDFDGTNGTAMSSTFQAEAATVDADMDKNGKMCCGYFPKADEPSVIDFFPGTHASSSLLANLVFNKYHMNTPVYREMVRLLNNRMNMSRNTVYNWFVKGSKHLNKVLPVLKEKLLAKGAVVNCDETLFYHTFIETCKMCGVSTLEYFKEFFNAAIKREQFRMYSRIVEREQLRMISKAIMQGRTDYENMLPMTIGIKK